MNDDIRQKLINLNLDFYNDFASSFARSRAMSESGLQKVIQHINPADRVLDLGCGHGRIAHLLPEDTLYAGMDYSSEMLNEARKSTAVQNRSATFVLGGLTDDDWPTQITNVAYHWIFLRAVLHHIPVYENRITIVRKAANLLADDGSLIIANWQFLNVERLRKRILPWSRLELEPDQVETGDYLLDWQRDGYGIRYVHLVDEVETRKIALDTGLHVEDIYFADGHTNDLTLYAQMKRPG